MSPNKSDPPPETRMGTSHRTQKATQWIMDATGGIE
ncbi:hypothetical protein EYZ11_009343 [Aspergillus tanneri]|uniref:Uncharacterized protein n=1 Tax=Aspergillus tanneri TaxID=1220188 RepID=A0A4V3UNH4_9EURO|nr:hypothetical protein EYZ11_009343 [Aspergillus tanneri]